MANFQTGDFDTGAFDGPGNAAARATRSGGRASGNPKNPVSAAQVLRKRRRDKFRCCNKSRKERMLDMFFSPFRVVLWPLQAFQEAIVAARHRQEDELHIGVAAGLEDNHQIHAGIPAGHG